MHKALGTWENNRQLVEGQEFQEFIEGQALCIH